MTDDLKSGGVTVDRDEDGRVRGISGTPEAIIEASQAAVAAISAGRGRISAPPLDHDVEPDAYYPWPAEDAFGDYDFMDAPDLEEIAEHLIDRFDRQLSEAGEWRIRYLWKKQGGASGGKPTGGKCLRATGLPKYLTGVDFIIWIAADHAFTGLATRRQVEAMLFHELCHVSTRTTEKGGDQPTVKPHDAEVFRAELEVYGLWHGGHKATFGQLELDFPEIPEGQVA